MPAGRGLLNAAKSPPPREVKELPAAVEVKVGKTEGREDPSTIQKKFMVGYQGWFGCGGDGEPIAPGHHGWFHWVDSPLPAGGRVTFDLWPDTSSYDEDELYTLEGVSLPPLPGSTEPRPAKVFSSRNQKTLNRHFGWMREYGISGAFLQRFLTEATSEIEGVRKLRDEILGKVRKAANEQGRVWAVMYDVSGIKGADVEERFKGDYLHLLNAFQIHRDPMYLHEAGKPVIAIWGMGMSHDQHDPTSLIRLIQWIKEVTPGGAYIFAGTPSGWRTRDGDADAREEFGELWRNVDCISPWYVGRFGDIEGTTIFKARMQDDIAHLKKEDAAFAIKRDYSPVVFPGFAWQNLHSGPVNQIPREGGTFLYRQLYNALDLDVPTVYGAMFDEYDESTALMPAATRQKDVPQKPPFLAYDADGLELPSDWYLRICAMAAKALDTGSKLPGAFPYNALHDYEKQQSASRPRIEDDSHLQIIRKLLAEIQPTDKVLAARAGKNSDTASLDIYKYENINRLTTLRDELAECNAVKRHLDEELNLQIRLLLLRLRGDKQLISAKALQMIDNSLESLPCPPSDYTRFLSEIIKPVFASSSHPSIDPDTGRKTAVAAGGDRARHEMFENQDWKGEKAWGLVGLFEQCVTGMPSKQVSDEIGLILPPLLVLLDDYDTAYRLEGLHVLRTLLDNIKPQQLNRMGIDRLFLNSVQHSISLHPSPPSPPLLLSSLRTLFQLLPIVYAPDTQLYADEIAKAVENGIVGGWQYAPSGMDGLEMLLEVGAAVEFMVEKLGVGIVRWLKSILPGLLSASHLPPSPFSIAQQLVNLQALHTLLTGIESTQRAREWRGQILDAVCRNWVGIEEKTRLRGATTAEEGDGDELEVTREEMEAVRGLLRVIVADLVKIQPDMVENELPQLVRLSETDFAGLVEGFTVPKLPARPTAPPPPLPSRKPGAVSSETPPLSPVTSGSRGPPPAVPPRPTGTASAGAQPSLPNRPRPGVEPVHAEELQPGVEQGLRRALPPGPRRGVAAQSKVPPKRNVPNPEMPEQEPPTRLDQARSQANTIIDRYTPSFEDRKKDALGVTKHLSTMAQNKITGAKGKSGVVVGARDVGEMGVRALGGLKGVGKSVVQGLQQGQQQFQEGRKRDEL